MRDELRSVVDLAFDAGPARHHRARAARCDVPLRVHARYQREEILAALDYARLERKPNSFREGVLYVAGAQRRRLLRHPEEVRGRLLAHHDVPRLPDQPDAVPLGVAVHHLGRVTDGPALPHRLEHQSCSSSASRRRTSSAPRRTCSSGQPSTSSTPATARSRSPGSSSTRCPPRIVPGGSGGLTSVAVARGRRDLDALSGTAWAGFVVATRELPSPGCRLRTTLGHSPRWSVPPASTGTTWSPCRTGASHHGVRQTWSRMHEEVGERSVNRRLVDSIATSRPPPVGVQPAHERLRLRAPPRSRVVGRARPGWCRRRSTCAGSSLPAPGVEERLVGHQRARSEPERLRGGSPGRWPAGPACSAMICAAAPVVALGHQRVRHMLQRREHQDAPCAIGNSRGKLLMQSGAGAGSARPIDLVSACGDPSEEAMQGGGSWHDLLLTSASRHVSLPHSSRCGASPAVDLLPVLEQERPRVSRERRSGHGRLPVQIPPGLESRERCSGS